MTTPLDPLRANQALVKNLLGLLVMLAAIAAVVVTAWATDWRLGVVAIAAPTGYGGYLLATSEN